MLYRFSGATVRRTIDRSHASVPEHAHDWPLLSLFTLGSYSSCTELGETVVAGPSAVLYAAGAAHRNTAGAEGFEQIEIEFDPAWLQWGRLPDNPVLQWTGGLTGAETRALVRLCSRTVSEQRLRAALQQFLLTALRGSRTRHPDWLDGVVQQLRIDPARNITSLARETGLHPSWLGTAYRQAAGEGLMETAARYRVERAARLLRETDVTFTQVAMESGFCDQSHMIRTFRRVLGRLPSAVRADREDIRQADSNNAGVHRSRC